MARREYSKCMSSAHSPMPDITAVITAVSCAGTACSVIWYQAMFRTKESNFIPWQNIDPAIGHDGLSAWSGGVMPLLTDQGKSGSCNRTPNLKVYWSYKSEVYLKTHKFSKLLNWCPQKWNHGFYFVWAECITIDSRSPTGNRSYK